MRYLKDIPTIDIDKVRRRDRIAYLENCVTATFGADKKSIEKLENEIRRQYIECLTVEPNDSIMRLIYKETLYPILLHILNQHNLTVYTPKEIKKKTHPRFGSLGMVIILMCMLTN
jgi:hypothetical protein